jgi:surface protein
MATSISHCHLGCLETHDEIVGDCISCYLLFFSFKKINRMLLSCLLTTRIVFQENAETIDEENFLPLLYDFLYLSAGKYSYSIRSIASIYLFWPRPTFLVIFGPFSFLETYDVHSFQDAFYGLVNFNQPINAWDLSEATSCRGMFQHAESFNQPLDNWDVSQVTDMGNMFYSAISFNQPLEKWNVSRVTNMEYMFGCTEVFNQSLSSWQVDRVVEMSGMFYMSESFNQPLEKWNVCSVRFFTAMFEMTLSFNQSLASWSFGPQVVSIYRLFRGCSHLVMNKTKPDGNLARTLAAWNTTCIADLVATQSPIGSHPFKRSYDQVLS